MGIETILNDPNELDGGLSGLADSKEDTEGGLAAQSYANGLITAVIVGPEEVSPAEWIARIVDLTDINIDGENAKAAVAAMLSEHRKIVASLMSSRNGYEPFFWQDSERRLVTRDWAEGFLAGIRLRAEAWKPLREGDGRVLTALLSALLQDAKIDAKMVEVGVDPKELFEAAKATLPDLIRSLYGMREERPFDLGGGQKIGRNDPCPCGSGEIYKKCCLN
jgi:uncharacterized protein